MCGRQPGPASGLLLTLRATRVIMSRPLKRYFWRMSPTAAASAGSRDGYDFLSIPFFFFILFRL